MRKILMASAAALSSLGALAAPAGADKPQPETIVLTSGATATTGFRAEGVVARGRYAWAGSLATGTIVRADLRTGEVATIVESAGMPAVGLDLDDHGRLWVSGGPSGTGRVYDAETGEEIASYQLADADTSFINDVITTGDAAYFTDSRAATIHRVPIGEDGTPGEAQALALTGDYELAEGFNNNGIVGVDSEPLTRLIVAQSTDPDGEGSALYAVDPDPAAGTATTTRIALHRGEGDTAEGDGDIANADGLVLRGRTLFVVENRLDRIAQIRLAADLREGVIERRLTDDDLATPTTATLAKGALYAVNAHFADLTPGVDPASIDFEIVRIDLGRDDRGDDKMDRPGQGPDDGMGDDTVADDSGNDDTGSDDKGPDDTASDRSVADGSGS
ncbi:MAG: superoxide dismutase [Acidimicrobiia bacterium]|nr:superoxide dismutase [Acidimicrobiia bacterium]